MNYIARQKKLAELLRRGGFDALLITYLPNVRYLCGFTGTAGVILFQAGQRTHKATFYTDGRYDQQAHEEVQSAKVVVGKKSAFVEGCEAALKAKIKTLGFEAEQLSFAAYQQLGQALRGKTKLKPAIGMIEQLRPQPKPVGQTPFAIRPELAAARQTFENVAPATQVSVPENVSVTTVWPAPLVVTEAVKSTFVPVCTCCNWNAAAALVLPPVKVTASEKVTAIDRTSDRCKLRSFTCTSATVGGALDARVRMISCWLLPPV